MIQIDEIFKVQFSVFPYNFSEQSFWNAFISMNRNCGYSSIGMF